MRGRESGKWPGRELDQARKSQETNPHSDEARAATSRLVGRSKNEQLSSSDEARAATSRLVGRSKNEQLSSSDEAFEPSLLIEKGMKLIKWDSPSSDWQIDEIRNNIVVLCDRETGITIITTPERLVDALTTERGAWRVRGAVR